MTMTINIIGAGKLGKTIGKLIAVHGAGEIVGVVNSTYQSAKEAVNFIGQGVAYLALEDLPQADLTFITTPDDAIQAICTKLIECNTLKENSVVVHCSGSLSSSILQSAKEKNCFLGSVHPMRSFSDPETSFAQYKGTYCAIEGNENAIAIVQSIFDAIGSKTYLVDGSKKAIYHTAGVFASNYMIALCQESLDLLKQAKVPDEIAIDLVMSLMSGTISNLEQTRSPEKALTGPIKRGDVQTIQQQANAITDELTQQLYKKLGLSILKLAHLSKEKAAAIKAILSSL